MRKEITFLLLGLVWYSTSRSDSCNTNFERWKRKVAAMFPDKEWDVKFIKPAETRWMVVFDGAKILEQRWEEITWLFCDWAPQNILKTAFKSYWSQSALMLQDPYIQVQVILAARRGELLFDWAYNWIRGKGGYFLEGDGVGRRLFPGMQWVELADFSLLFLRKLEYLRAHHKVLLPSVLEFARTYLKPNEAEHFLVNFTEDRGCFSNVRDRWTKWMGRHQELPLSMARLGCSSFYVVEGLKGETPLEQAVGQEFAMAFLKVVWPEQFIGPCRSERETFYADQLGKDWARATADRAEDELTFGLFSLFRKDADLKSALVDFAKSAHGNKKIDVGALKGTSTFTPLWELGRCTNRHVIGFISLSSTNNWWSRSFTSTIPVLTKRIWL
ncbi:unnamed protein product [Ascophyllum nodosum]